jgi:hypothetical protein
MQLYHCECPGVVLSESTTVSVDVDTSEMCGIAMGLA